MGITPKILIVDDKPANLLVLRELLSALDAEVIPAQSGNDALRLLIDHDFAVALLDVQMPEMDGYELASLIRSDATTRRMPIVFVSAVYSDQFHQIKGMESGAVDFVVKPIVPELLLPKVAVFLDIYRYQLQLHEEIQERLKAEEALKESEERFRFLSESSFEAIFVSHDDCILDANEAATGLFGYAVDRLVGMDCLELIAPQGREQLLSMFSKNRLTPFETIAMRQDGSTFPVRIQARQMTHQGRPARVFSVTNISERKAIEERFRIAVQCANYLVYEADHLEGRIEWFGNVDGMLGYEPGEFPRTRDAWFEIIHPDDRRQIVRALDAVDPQQSAVHLDYRIRHSDGDWLRWQDRSVGFFDAAGRVNKRIGVCSDVTEQTRMETLLRQAQKMEAVGQLAGGVAHDFNNLLQVMKGYTDIVLEEVEPDSLVHRHISQICKATNRATALVRQLLSFSRRQPMRPEYLDLGRVVTDLIKMLKRVIGEHIELHVEMGEGLGLVYADPGQIEQVLMNLCVNARDAMSQGGKISITLQNTEVDEAFCEKNAWARMGDFVLLTISDTGKGIPIDIQEHIFEPFFTTKDIGEGTGLGLSTVYAIVKRHEGFIQVESAPDQGADFLIYLPMAKSAPQIDVVKDVEPQPAGGTETILLAEDDEWVRDLAIKILQRAGYRLILAKDGEEAILAFEAHCQEVDLALLDVVMPRKSGRLVYEAIQKIRPDLPILFSSGYSFKALETGQLPEGGFDLIQKPFSPHDLLSRVRRALERRDPIQPSVTG